VASNPAPNPGNTDKLKSVLGTVTSAAGLIEQLLASTGVIPNEAEAANLTQLFGNLAGVAIQAAHDVVGKPVTPESVLALMPVATALVDPPAAQPAPAS
jgi:hypothetical protein